MDHGTVISGSVRFHILEEMTNCFSEDRELGHGSYGKVYLGENKHGEKIAIKLLDDMLGLDDKKFETECLNLASLRHNNIVQLVGYCHETIRQYVMYNVKYVHCNSTKRALCLEYMNNGSLDKCLSDESCGHDWYTRYAIIKGICNGLKYLHEELKPHMYHLDLKPANVLLNGDMVPKIADFNLSRLFGDQQTQRTKTIIGTFGYLPPEYIEAGIISIKSDIFSLGVVIIKIMKGPDGYFRSSEMSSQEFIHIVHKNWRNRLRATSVSELESYSKQVKTCIEIALSCLEADRHKRPSIGDIVNKLNGTETMLQFGSVLTKHPGSLMASIEKMSVAGVGGCEDKDSACRVRNIGWNNKSVAMHYSAGRCHDNDQGCHDNIDGAPACQDDDSSCKGSCKEWRALCRDTTDPCHHMRPSCHDNNRGCPNTESICRIYNAYWRNKEPSPSSSYGDILSLVQKIGQQNPAHLLTLRPPSLPSQNYGQSAPSPVSSDLDQ